MMNNNRNDKGRNMRNIKQVFKMNEKQKQIITVATTLFGKQGIYATSIQQIADECGISKGAFYLQFKSKDELILSIVKYFYSMIHETVQQIEQSTLPPREQFAKQLYVQFEHIIQNKSVYMMLVKEQSIPLNKEIDEYIQSIRKDIENWYVKKIPIIYGEQVKPYIVDLTILFEGIRSFYEQLLLIDDFDIELDELAHYILRRYDDLVSGIIKRNEKPLITTKQFGSFYDQETDKSIHENVRKQLLSMEKIITQTNLKQTEKEQLHETIDYLLSELEREDIRLFIFKGMLANFENIKQIQPQKQTIQKLLGI